MPVKTGQRLTEDDCLVSIVADISEALTNRSTSDYFFFLPCRAPKSVPFHWSFDFIELWSYQMTSTLSSRVATLNSTISKCSNWCSVVCRLTTRKERGLIPDRSHLSGCQSRRRARSQGKVVNQPRRATHKGITHIFSIFNFFSQANFLPPFFSETKTKS